MCFYLYFCCLFCVCLYMCVCFIFIFLFLFMEGWAFQSCQFFRMVGFFSPVVFSLGQMVCFQGPAKFSWGKKHGAARRILWSSLTIFWDMVNRKALFWIYAQNSWKVLTFCTKS